MVTCKSVRTVMQLGYRLACQVLPQYASKFSRKDFTLPRLFACLLVKQQLKLSYRKAEAFLQDVPQWLQDIGLSKAPDHNTLQRAAKARMLKLASHPLAVDSTTYESHHVSRHYEQRCHETRRKMRKKELEKHGSYRTHSQTVRKLPKLAVAVASGCHLALAFWTGTGAGSDHPHFQPLLKQVRARVPHRHLKTVADAGYDSEVSHRDPRQRWGIRTVIPPEHGRPPKDGGPPSQYWRRQMKRHLASPESRQRCGYNWRSQSETVHSMMKRNCSSAVAGKSAWSRRRDMALKTLTHDLMVLD